MNVSEAIEFQRQLFDKANIGNRVAALEAEFDKRGVNVQRFGAVGDGQTDDTAAIQATINAVRDAGGGEVFIPAGRYKIPGTNTLTLYSNVSLRGVKGVTILDFSDRSAVIYKHFVNAFGTISAGVNITADVAVNKNVIQLNTATFAEGDLIIITSNAEWLEVGSPGNSSPNGEYAIVDEILSASKMRIKSATHDTYTVANVARVHKVNPVKDITIDGIEFRGRGRINNGDGDGDCGVGITYGQRIVVSNCSFVDIDSYQLEFRSCYDCRAEGNYHFHSKYFSPSGGVGENKPAALAIRGTVQYQVRTSDCCQYITVRDCVAEGGRHFFNTGHSYRYMDGSTGAQVGQLFGINRYIRVENCSSKNTWHAGFSTHGDAEHVEFVSCTSENTGIAGFNPRSKHVRMVDCSVVNSKYGYMLSDFPQTVEILDCRTINCTTYVTMNETTASTLDYKNIRIDGCYFEGGVEGIYLNAVSTGMAGELNICNNIIINTVNTGNYSPIRVIGRWKGSIDNNKIINTSIGYQIRLENVDKITVSNNTMKNGYRLLYADASCTRVITFNNLFLTHSFGTIDNNATTKTTQNDLIL